MPRTAADNQYEQDETTILSLPDFCDISVWAWGLDDGGGRQLMYGDPTVYVNVPCRLFPDKPMVERSDPSGERVVSDWVMQVPFGAVVDEEALASRSSYVRVRVTQLNNGAVNRFFYVVSYAAHSEMVFRTLYLRELL